MPQLITIGETMAAFTPDSVGALRYVQNFGIRTAGAESNVAPLWKRHKCSSVRRFLYSNLLVQKYHILRGSVKPPGIIFAPLPTRRKKTVSRCGRTQKGTPHTGQAA